MKKSELVELLNKLSIPVNEGESSTKNANVYPRIVFWDYIWEDRLASGENYDEVETYQISFFSQTPRHPKLLELRNELRKLGYHPTILHEYVEEKGKDRKYYHSYFSLEVINDECNN